MEWDLIILEQHIWQINKFLGKSWLYSSIFCMIWTHIRCSFHFKPFWMPFKQKRKNDQQKKENSDNIENLKNQLYLKNIESVFKTNILLFKDIQINQITLVNKIRYFWFFKQKIFFGFHSDFSSKNVGFLTLIMFDIPNLLNKIWFLWLWYWGLH